MDKEQAAKEAAQKAAEREAAAQKAAEREAAAQKAAEEKRKELAAKIAALTAKEEKLKQQKRKLLSEQSKKEKAARTHRLCEIGGIVEKVYGKPLDTIAKREAFQDWLMKVMHKSV